MNRPRCDVCDIEAPGYAPAHWMRVEPLDHVGVPEAIVGVFCSLGCLAVHLTRHNSR
jgi:hypothetical protein